MLVAANPLIEVRLGTDGLDDRLLRDHVLRPQEIRVRCNPEDRSTSAASGSASSIEEAEKARNEARRLLEEHRALIGQARGQSEQILAEARKVAESMARRVKEETEADRQRRLEETKRQIEAETQRALQQIRAEVAELTLIATAKVTGKVLDDSDHKRLIEEAIRDLDFSVLERRRPDSRRPPHLRARALRGCEGAGAA